MNTLADVATHERSLGLAEAAFSCAMSGPESSLRQTMLNSIVLVGGSACIPNLHTRFMRDLRTLVPTTTNVSMLKCAPPAGSCSRCFLSLSDRSYMLLHRVELRSAHSVMVWAVWSADL